jgi:polygalacturonase
MMRNLTVAMGILALLSGCAMVGSRQSTLPAVPDRQFNLRDFGAAGDGKAYDTPAFTLAVAAISAAGGGHLNVPPGTYLTLPFALTSHMDLHLEAGSIIQFPADLAAYGLPADAADATDAQMDYLKEKMPALIGARNASDISVSGSGIIDGGGSAWWPLVRGADGGAHTSYGDSRPKLLVLSGCRSVWVHGVTLRNSPMYHLVPTLCHDVLIESVQITAPPKAPNTDAIDPMACDGVVIRDCVLDVGDDNVAVKAIQGPCTNILVENCHCLHGHGISIGSETYQGIHDVSVRECSFDGTTNGIRIKSARDRGNELYGFDFSNITMKNVTIAISINLYYMDRTGSRTRHVMAVTQSTPFLRDVTVSNVTVTDAQTAGEITGLPESPVRNVTFNGVHISATKGFTVRDATQIVFRDVQITAATGEAFTSQYAQVDWAK